MANSKTTFSDNLKHKEIITLVENETILHKKNKLNSDTSAIISIILLTIYRGCLYDNWKPSFLPRLIFNWGTFSRRVKARW